MADEKRKPWRFGGEVPEFYPGEEERFDRETEYRDKALAVFNGPFRRTLPTCPTCNGEGRTEHDDPPCYRRCVGCEGFGSLLGSLDAETAIYLIATHGHHYAHGCNDFGEGCDCHVELALRAMHVPRTPEHPRRPPTKMEQMWMERHIEELSQAATFNSVMFPVSVPGETITYEAVHGPAEG